MATTYDTPLDARLIQAVLAENNGIGTSIADKLASANTFSSKLKAVQGMATKYSSTPAILGAAINWIKSNNAGVLDTNGQPYTDGFYTDLLAGSTKDKASTLTTLNTARTNYATDYVNSVVDLNKTLGTAQKAAAISTITEGNTTTPYNPKIFNKAVSATASSAPYTPGKYANINDFKAAYGGLKDPDTGEPVFSDADLNAVFAAKTLGDVLPFNNRLTALANQAIAKQQGSSYVASNPTATATAARALASDPTKLLDSVNALATTAPKFDKSNGNTGTGTGLGQTPALSKWHAPQQGIATTNSPYSGLLDAMLNKVTGANYGTPETNKTYDALTSALTQGVGVNSLSKPQVTYKGDNTAGITGLGIDYTGKSLTPLNTQVTSSPSYTPNQIANAKTALDNAKTIAREKAAAEKAKWIQDTQNAYTNPLDYYNALANNTKYEDLAAIGKSSVAQYTPMAAQAAADKAAADRTAWLTNLQNTAKSPQDYYNTLANNTQYSDLAAVGKSYVSTPVQTQLQQPQTQTINLGNTGIVTPEVSKFASTDNLNTDAGGISHLLAQDTSAQQTTQSSPQTFTLSSPNQSNQQVQSTVASSNQTAQPMSADKTAWLTNLQNTAKSPQEYYNALANNTQYSDLAAIGNQNLSPVTQTAPQTFTLK